MDPARRLELVTRGTEEIITRDELKTLLETKSRPRAYWGFELSGFLHLGTGLVCGNKIKDFVEAGFDFTILLADTHSFINKKLGGKWENISVAAEYFRHCFIALGIDPKRVRYLRASEMMNRFEYWFKALQVARSSTINRMRRALPIMGREMTGDDVEAAFLWYPALQAADIFDLDLHVAASGLDQRKAHMLARDVAGKLGWRPPVCVHTPLLPGLTETKQRMEYDEDEKIAAKISGKMSKSLPQSTITVHDSPEVLKEKVKGAFCPPKQVEGNPITEIARLIIFGDEKAKFMINRPTKYGGPLEVQDYPELEKAYLEGKLHPTDLKEAVADTLITMLKPVRDYFAENPEPLEAMKKIAVTR
ncbi:MAG: tyrosine--tRNA ligase [Promethearchaeati archaeon SRVP18_Atabeyarchaeia-1]